MSPLYYAYGSNMDHEQMRERCPGGRFREAARLTSYRLAFTRYSRNRGGGVADIVSDPTAEVWGALWEVTEEHLTALDRYEGARRDPPACERIEVTVEAAGVPASAIAYRVVQPLEGDLRPSTEYRDALVRGARASGLPSAYLACLEGLPTVQGN